LEFRQLPRPLGDANTRFASWIREVIAYRRMRDADPKAAQQLRQSAVRSGLMQSQQAGVVGLGEIATSGWSAEAFQATDLQCRAFWELLGPSQRFEQQMAGAKQFLQEAAANRHLLAGLSPHAPYTVHPKLLEATCRLARRFKLPVAMHVAESAEELQLLRERSGPLVELLEELDSWEPMALAGRRAPLDVLQELDRAPQVLVIHGNYLSVDEIEFLAQRRDRFHVVYCPRTHAYFGHPTHPLPDLLRNGVSVALGTDSRASNPDLSLLAEMQWVAATFPQLAPEQIVRLGTSAGAEALGISNHLGRIAEGYSAQLTVIDLPPGRASDPYGWLYDNRCTARPWSAGDY
jgi:aminodeoxyfutalosine deaminase